MNDYIVAVKTNKDMGSESFVRRLLEEWCNELGDHLKPEFFGLGEPVRQSFASLGIETAVETWVSQGMSLYLRRRTKPKFLASIEWFRREKGLDRRLFPWSCTVYLSPSAGSETALKLLKFLIRHFDPAFGYITTYQDDRDKHFISFPIRQGTTEMYTGMDIMEDEEILPGVYWTTYFGPWAVEKIGKERLFEVKAENFEWLNDGCLIQAYPVLSSAGSSPARESEAQIVDWLGKRNFFNVADVDIELLRTNLEPADRPES